MGGQLRVESELGKGSTFSFAFPKKEVLGTIATEEVEEMSQNVPITEGVTLTKIIETQTADATRNTILIVEDNQSLRDYLTLILETKYNVLKAENGQVALEMMNDELKMMN